MCIYIPTSIKLCKDFVSLKVVHTFKFLSCFSSGQLYAKVCFKLHVMCTINNYCKNCIICQSILPAISKSRCIMGRISRSPGYGTTLSGPQYLTFLGYLLVPWFFFYYGLCRSKNDCPGTKRSSSLLFPITATRERRRVSSESLSLFTEVGMTCQCRLRHCGIATALQMVKSGAASPLVKIDYKYIAVPGAPKGVDFWLR